MLDVAGASPVPLLVGAIDRLHDLGVSDFDASLVPVDDDTEARTLDFLESRL